MLLVSAGSKGGRLATMDILLWRAPKRGRHANDVGASMHLRRNTSRRNIDEAITMIGPRRVL